MKQLASAAFGVAALAALGWLLDRYLNAYYLNILVRIGINIILAVSLNLINGFTGLFSIGHAGFMAIGAYTSAAVSVYGGPGLHGALDPITGPACADLVLLTVALAAGSVLAALAGLLVGVPTLRLRSDYLAIATLGFGEIIRVLILNLDVVGGARGFTGIPALAGFSWVYLFVVATIVTVNRMVRSARGLAFLAVREDDLAADVMGLDSTRYKVTAFLVGSFFAGIAGGLFAHFDAYLHTNSFTFMRSIEIIVMVVLGGMGSISGSVASAALLTLLPELLRRVGEYRMVIYSLTLIVLMLTRPQGVLGDRELDLRPLVARLRWRREDAV
ncbi:MAG TPA: branched-chain amino acid ABC transporter permease [Candidatus Binatia bacterium]|nr:branched-chain amino acid ABC transporter permease [Candidatus Binatia bacterium]